MAENKYPTDVIPLPTKGWFYPEGHPLASGEIELKQMTAKEEDILANPQLRKSGKFLEKLLESLIVNKDIKHEEILMPDKNAIFLAIRRLAYGDEYPIMVTCAGCGEQNKLSVNLGSVENKAFTFDNFKRGVNEFTFKLPTSGTVLTYKLLDQSDEKNIETELTQLKKLGPETSRELTTRLKWVLTSVDGNPDKGAIRKFVDEKLLARDSLALRKAMRETTPDIDFAFDFKCSNCGYERRQDIPLGLSFLWPDFDA